jgi:hypothetical protein
VRVAAAAIVAGAGASVAVLAAMTVGVDVPAVAMVAAGVDVVATAGVLMHAGGAR